jgi:protein phosphatase/serine/threonine-protein phosphatase Stp1
MNTEGNRVRSIASSDTGRVRRVNEDAFLERPDIGLWAVADGMGGHSRGDVASKMVRDALAAMPAPTSGLDLLQTVRATLLDVHDALLWEAREAGDDQTMGTTVVVLLIHDDHYACVWVGDSRCYMLRDGELGRVTHDHSVVQDMIDNGSLKEHEAESHPLSNVVTQALGAPVDLAPSTVHGPLRKGDLLLLCSDGLTRMVPEAEIARLLRDRGVEAVDDLIAEALRAGGRDNVTVIAVAPYGEDGGGRHVAPSPTNDALDDDVFFDRTVKR